jgi:hypothetical protein
MAGGGLEVAERLPLSRPRRRVRRGARLLDVSRLMVRIVVVSLTSTDLGARGAEVGVGVGAQVVDVEPLAWLSAGTLVKARSLLLRRLSGWSRLEARCPVASSFVGPVLAS